MSEDNSQKTVNWLRIIFSVLYFMLGVVLILLFWRRIFYLEVDHSSWHIYRFIWCCSATCFGFASVAFVLRHHPKSPVPGYITHYPVQLLAMASLICGGLHLFKATSGFQFYYISFGLCFTLGYLVDNYWSFIKAIIARADKP